MNTGLLTLAAKNAADPKWLGEVIFALAGRIDEKKLDKGQRVLLGILQGEEEKREERKANAAERQRRFRARRKEEV